MIQPVHILIVEDEIAIAMDIELRLKRMGYIVDGIALDAAEALEQLDRSVPDVLLLDVQLGDTMDGLRLSRELNGRGFPIIFLTAFGDAGTFVQALETKPAGYVLKPFRDDDLQRTIALALQQKQQPPPREHAPAGSDTFFIRDKNELVRLELSEIRWIEALDNYTRVHTAAKIYTVKTFLKDILEKLPPQQFIRIHRSYVVPVSKISRIEENTLYIEKQALPVGRQYRDELRRRVQII